MKFDKNTRILIVGLGVIGGGYARALSDAGYHVSCITKEQKDIEYALERGMIEYGTTKLEKELIRGSELIIFAIYPKTFIEWIESNQSLFSPGTLITDVSGVKGSVVPYIQSILRDDVEFISAHPMAGRERSGVEFSDPSVFIGANYIVTPTEKNSKEAIEICKELGRALGFARISELDITTHDEMIAFLSQLTHVIAVALMNSNDFVGLEKYTGDSFRDLTRIAKINDKMWSELFLMNKDMLIGEIDMFVREMNTMKDLIMRGDEEALRDKMRTSTAHRLLFDKPRQDK